LIGRFLLFVIGFYHPATLRIDRCFLGLVGEGEGNPDGFEGSVLLLLLIFRSVFAEILCLVVTFARVISVLLALINLAVFIVVCFFLVILDF